MTRASRKWESVLKESSKEELLCPNYLPLGWTNMNELLISSMNQKTEPSGLVKHLTKNTLYLI